ncbi:MAG: hypothetical protein ABR980_01830 [Ignavibacteriaceae bacterium]|jgi:hypothetical protein
MKSLLLLFFAVLIIFTGCSKKEEVKLTAFSTEAFAYGMGDSSEIDGTTHVKGFKQDQKNNLYSSTLSYDIDLITPKGDTVKSIVSRVVDKFSKEKLSDTQLDTQFNIGTSFIKGKYKLIFRIKDALSGAVTSSTANFEVEN